MTAEKAAIAVEVIMDNSGSMQVCKEQVVDGLNEFINQLSTAVLPAQLSITLFDDCLKRKLVENVSVGDRPRIQYHDYNPMHGTENIAFSVIQGLEKLEPVNAHQKALVVVTDGLNRSTDMDKAKELVAKRQKEGWLVLWLGVYYEPYERCNNAKKHLKSYAANLGIPKGVTFILDCMKINEAMPIAAEATLRFAISGDAKEAAFTAKERASL